ncbi:hypothetical protein B0O99DRAFT_588114 [Bisporella sp. PMI_857]|nr:hypothetical protein B0O99DRAFT_588114 [Bisporella sp. PMI_857]
MSDPVLPPPRSSSVSDGDRSDSSNYEADTDISLNQPADSTSQQDDAARKGNRIDGKQKRKRTSTRDQAVLEAEYKENPKPSKAARAIIVEKVDLNEKEVQIWFQNRRQINRRKSRPLLPHEVAAFGLGGMAALSSDPASSLHHHSSQSSDDSITAPLNSEPDGPTSSYDKDIVSTLVSQASQALSEQYYVKDNSVDETGERVDRSLECPRSTTPALKTHSSFRLADGEETSFALSESANKSFSSTPGYLANRWNASNTSFSTPLSSQIPQSITPPIHAPDPPSSCPERIGVLNESISSSSSVRLSMSLDGKAELVDTPSSPVQEHRRRPRSSGAAIQQKRRSLQRSRSALPFGHSPRSLPPFIPHLTSGRSRDARSWEFCCDPDARDELTTQAENESTGSAVAAISLLRSTSSAALKSNNNKRNAPATKRDGFDHGKKPKLGRAQSSLARLQGSEMPMSKPKGNDGLMRSPSGDSDKENWLPGEGGTQPRRRPLPSSRPDNYSKSKIVLGDNHSIMSHAGNLGASKSRRRRGPHTETKVFEDQDGGDEEVERFMRGEVSPSKKGDLDCIQGLLSLSQGNWQ